MPAPGRVGTPNEVSRCQGAVCVALVIRRGGRRDRQGQAIDVAGVVSFGWAPYHAGGAVRRSTGKAPTSQGGHGPSLVLLLVHGCRAALHPRKVGGGPVGTESRS
jgi:hypothetical protein